MKKKLFATLLTLVLALTMLAGCGDGSGSSSGSSSEKSKDTIPLSEVIFSDEDVVVYTVEFLSTEDYTKKGINKDKKPTDIFLLTTDGNARSWDTTHYESRKTLGEVAQTSDEEFIVSLGDGEDKGAVSWNIITDGSGNNTDCIYGYGARIGFKSFLGHITIYDESFMAFSSCDEEGSDYGLGYKKIWLIRDTEYTIDKTVYFDEPGTDGFTVDGK